MSTAGTDHEAAAEPPPDGRDDAQPRELTPRALLLGLVMAVILGAANAYLGLRAGMTIAATYPAAVISMAVLRLRKGSILEENLARTVGSIGESVAAGAVFTLPAFVISGAWASFGFRDAYWKSTALMAVGGALGVLFVTLLRRMMVEDPELPFPESLAASEIHAAGREGPAAAKLLFSCMGTGALVYVLGQLRLFDAGRTFVVRLGEPGGSVLRLGSGPAARTLRVGGATIFQAPATSPAFLGVGYILGPRLAALSFAGGVVAWGLLVPLLVYLLGPTLSPGGEGEAAEALFRVVVRPIAVGGMLVGAAATLFHMRKNLASGLRRAASDLRRSAAPRPAPERTQRDLRGRVTFAGLGAALVLMALLYARFAGTLGGGVIAALVMIVVGFFFAAVSGNLVGMIGSSNNPVSGLTLCTLIIAALLVLAVGVSGAGGVAAALGVAAVVCVSSAVAGEMLQDLKVGHILGGTPWRMQVGELFGVAVSSAALYFPLLVLQRGNIQNGGTGFGDPQLPAPQAGLMAALAKGIVGGEMAWPLVVVGILMGLAMILLEVKSVMLFAVGMYLPLETTFAIFVGGVVRWITRRLCARRGLDDARRARVDSAGVMVASGLVAGEALAGLLIAACSFLAVRLPAIFARPAAISGFVVIAILAFVLVKVPLSKAGR